jgi:hypothetical protein
LRKKANNLCHSNGKDVQAGMENCVKEIELHNGLTVFIYDHTRRYYEDYHLVRLELCCEVRLETCHFKTDEEFRKAREHLGESVTYRRVMEKMGVSYAEIDKARNVLIDSFKQNALRYVATDDFPRKLVLSELAKILKKIAKPTGMQEQGENLA